MNANPIIDKAISTLHASSSSRLSFLGWLWYGRCDDTTSLFSLLLCGGVVAAALRRRDVCSPRESIKVRYEYDSSGSQVPFYSYSNL
jgi:hypothetical protein